MTLVNQKSVEEYKHCAGRDCKEQGVHYLKIRFIKKRGWFCDLCKDILLDDELADEIV